MNQIRVDVQNAIIGLQQARARYDAAVQGRMLSQQTFEGDKKKYDLGASTPYQVVQDQRDLASAQSSEAQAMANYSHARIAFDQALGTTLEVNHISLDEAMAGHVKARAQRTRGQADEDPLAVLSLLLAPLCWRSSRIIINPVRPQAPILWRPYLPVTVPPVRLANSPRLGAI